MENHILVIRLSAMGDVAMTVPVLKALTKQNPDTQITVLTRPSFKAFFENIDNVSVFTIDINDKHKGILGIYKLYKDLTTQYKFTEIADLHSVIRTKALTLLFKLNGFECASINKGRSEKKALTSASDKKLLQLKHSTERYADVFRNLGFPVSLRNILPDKPKNNSNKIFDTLGAKQNNKWLGIAPFAQHKGKILPLEKTEEVVKKLSRNNNIKMFIIGGGKEELEFSLKLEERYPNVQSVIGKFSLSEEMDLISKCDAVFCMDSSNMHIASLVGTKTISIWGATHHFAGFYGFGQDINNIIQIEDLDCRPCSVYGNKPCFRKDYACLNNIQVSDIVKKINFVLNENNLIY